MFSLVLVGTLSHSVVGRGYIHLISKHLMGIISAIIIGLVVGAIAKFLMPGKDPGGCLVTIVIGLVGSFIGGFLGQALGFYREGEPAGFIGSIVGAVILLGFYRFIAKRRT